MLLKLRSFIFTLIMIYPFWYFIPTVSDSLGHFFEILYFSFVDGLAILYLSFYISRIKLAGIGFLLTLFVWLLQFSNVSDIRPYFFISTLFILSLFSAQENGRFNYGWLRIYTVIFILLSVISFVLPWSYIDDGLRFKGFSLSPTHYSVYALCGVVFTLESIKNKVIKVMFLFIFAFLIYRSETRLALVVLLMIIGFYSFKHITLYFRRAVALSVICVFSLSYLVYSFIVKYSDIFSMRYGAGEDKSYEARTLIQSHVLDDWQNSSFIQYIFGHGAEAARNMLIDIYGFDIMPHNDFLKLLYDFGILGFIVFIVAVYKLGRINLLAISLLTIYISAFYHNMAYSLFVIATMTMLCTNRITGSEK